MKPTKYHPIVSVRALFVCCLIAAGVIAASSRADAMPHPTVNYGDTYGYTSIVHSGLPAGSYYVTAHDSKADGRRFCSQTGNSTLTSVPQVCATTSTGPQTIISTTPNLYWFRLCHQTYPNVPTTDMRYTSLTCTAWQRINLAHA